MLLTAKVQAAQDGSFAHLPFIEAILLKPFDPLRLASQVADALGWKTDVSRLAQLFGRAVEAEQIWF